MRLLFSLMPLQLRALYLKKRGITLGTRLKGKRKIYLYMLRSFFIEVVYENDDSRNRAENLTIVPGLTITNLNDYFEKEFRASR